MRAFAELLEHLALSPGRDAKRALLVRYFATTPDPDRGYALAALTGAGTRGAAGPAMLRALATSRVDPVLFALSYDFVGDLAETLALIWLAPAAPADVAAAPRLSAVVEQLAATSRSALPTLIEGWLDRSDAPARFALLKLITGGLRVGVSAGLARAALAAWAGVEDAAITEAWHAVAPPYLPLFAWLEGSAPRPDAAGQPVFRAPMLAHPLPGPAALGADPAQWRAEWKWDGVRVQLIAGPGGRRLFSRNAEDLSGAFPDILAAMDFHATLDGELLVMPPDAPPEAAPAPFAALQRRLARKRVGARLLAEAPAAVRIYDMLFEAEEDLRTLPFDARRTRLEAWFSTARPARMALSEMIPFADVAALQALTEGARAAGIEGLMLKRADSPYLPGRPRGLWWKWKRAALSIDAVLMYAERGHGKRGSYFSDFTFGLWQDTAEGPALVPVGKAYSGFTDQELGFLDRFVRNHITARFGPVREVEKSLVLEIAFDAAQRSTRHRSGVALRFPRILRIRTDKPAADADRLETLLAMI